MKQTSLFVIVLILTSFTMTSKTIFDTNHFKGNFVKVKDHLLVSKYETTNLEFRNFLKDILNDNQNQLYKSCLPDTLCWRDKLNSNEPYIEYYFRHPTFNDYPVVGITFEAAKEYCSWLTINYNKDAKRKFKKVTFTLLSNEDWKFAANKGDTTKKYTWGTGFIQDKRKNDLCNYRREEYNLDSSARKSERGKMTSSQNLEYTNKYTASVNSYWPNSFGIFNMCGNVAEMIDEKGIAKGGSYNDPSYNVTISSEKKYTKPSSEIGFRVAMKVIEE